MPINVDARLDSAPPDAEGRSPVVTNAKATSQPTTIVVRDNQFGTRRFPDPKVNHA